MDRAVTKQEQKNIHCQTSMECTQVFRANCFDFPLCLKMA